MGIGRTWSRGGQTHCVEGKEWGQLASAPSAPPCRRPCPSHGRQHASAGWTSGLAPPFPLPSWPRPEWRAESSRDQGPLKWKPRQAMPAAAEEEHAICTAGAVARLQRSKHLQLPSEPLLRCRWPQGAAFKRRARLQRALGAVLL